MKNKYVLIGVLIIALTLGLMFGKFRAASVIKHVAKDTGCPVEQIHVKFRGGRSSYADVVACGKAYVYYQGFATVSRQE